jgi:hypothetical protein
MFTADTYRLARRLGVLPDVLRPLTSSCKGFACVCKCEDCLARENGENTPRPAACQPWEGRKAA